MLSEQRSWLVLCISLLSLTKQLYRSIYILVLSEEIDYPGTW